MCSRTGRVVCSCKGRVQQCPSIDSKSTSTIDIEQIIQFDELVSVWWMFGSLLFVRTDLVV